MVARRRVGRAHVCRNVQFFDRIPDWHQLHTQWLRMKTLLDKMLEKIVSSAV